MIAMFGCARKTCCCA